MATTSVKYTSRIPAIAAELHPKVQAALHASAEGIADRAKQRAPVETGRLRDAIHVERDGDDVYILGGDSEVWYGHLVEYGTRYVPAQPFLVPAAEEGKDDTVAAVVAALRTL